MVFALDPLREASFALGEGSEANQAVIDVVRLGLYSHGNTIQD